MLTITRKTGEGLLIFPDVDPNTTVGELFADGPMYVQVFETHTSSARLAISAPKGLAILRDELKLNQVINTFIDV